MRPQAFALPTLALFVAALAAACGGGAHTAPTLAALPAGPTSSPTSGAATQSLASATFSVSIPKRITPASKKRSPQYVSAGTASIIITLNTVNGAQNTSVAPVDLEIPSPNCVTNPADTANLKCTVSDAIPPGTDSVTIAAWAQAGGTGALLSSQTLVRNYDLGVINNITYTLDANPANASFAVSGPGGAVTGNTTSGFVFAAGSGAQPFVFTLTDASGNVITGGGAPAYSASVNPSSLATASISGTTLTITPTAGGSGYVALIATSADPTDDGLSSQEFDFPITINAATPTPSPSPTASPTATPTPSPSPTPTAQATIQAIADGGFNAAPYNYPTSANAWYACYAARTSASIAPTDANPTPISAATSYPTGGPTTGPNANDITIQTAVVSKSDAIPTPTPVPSASPALPTPAPTMIGATGALDGSATHAALVGYAQTAQRGKYTSGICQNITVPNFSAVLTLSVYEGGNDKYFSDNDSEADIYPSSAFGTAYPLTGVGGVTPSIGGTAYKTSTTQVPTKTLFAETECYAEGTSYANSATATPCSPGATGNGANGDTWREKGPYDLSAYAGQNVTLFLGIFGSTGSTTYDYFAYFTNVSITGYATAPSAIIHKNPMSVGGTQNRH